MSGFVMQYIAANAPQQPVPNAIILDTIDDAPPDPIDDAFPEIQIQIEGSFPLPFYGHQRPSTDYFNSNLMMQNFIISDITTNRNNVLIYNERGQGKGADALCSLRLLFHLRLILTNAVVEDQQEHLRRTVSTWSSCSMRCYLSCFMTRLLFFFLSLATLTTRPIMSLPSVETRCVPRTSTPLA
jgi:hypothetical protein